jgi:hypothetical protein
MRRGPRAARGTRLAVRAAAIGALAVGALAGDALIGEPLARRFAVRLALARRSPGRLAPTWLGLGRPGLSRLPLAWLGLAWLGLGRLGLAWLGVAWLAVPRRGLTAAPGLLVPVRGLLAEWCRLARARHAPIWPILAHAVFPLVRGTPPFGWLLSAGPVPEAASKGEPSDLFQNCATTQVTEYSPCGRRRAKRPH